jgi:hypothetical protein
MEIRIDPEFQGLIYHLSDEESTQLEANILAEGCRDPLVVWKEEQILLDGHHRKRICESHQLPYHVSELSLPDRYAATVWMINHQLGRRNLTGMQASDLRGRRYKIEREREGSGAPQGNQNAEKQKSENPTFVFATEARGETPEEPTTGGTAQRLADEYGVNRDTIFEEAKFSNALETLTNALSPTMRQSVTSPPPNPEPPPTSGHGTGSARTRRRRRRSSYRPTKREVVEIARIVKEQQVVLLPFMTQGTWPDHALMEATKLLGGSPKPNTPRSTGSSSNRISPQPRRSPS